MSIQNIARKKVVTATPDATVPELSRLMEENTVGSVVIQEEGKPVGIVTDRDLALKVVGRRKDPDSTTAENIMAENLFTANENQSVYDVIKDTCEAGVRRIPITSENGELVGIVTMDDLFLHMVNQMQKLSGIVFWESPEPE